jgi:hypothetical protein
MLVMKDANEFAPTAARAARRRLPYLTSENDFFWRAGSSDVSTACPAVSGRCPTSGPSLVHAAS